MRLFDSQLVRLGIPAEDVEILRIARRLEPSDLTISEKLFREVVLRQCTRKLMPWAEEAPDVATRPSGRTPVSAHSLRPAGSILLAELAEKGELEIDDFFSNRPAVDDALRLSGVSRRDGWEVVRLQLRDPNTRANVLLAETRKAGKHLVEEEMHYPFEHVTRVLSLSGALVLLVCLYPWESDQGVLADLAVQGGAITGISVIVGLCRAWKGGRGYGTRLSYGTATTLALLVLWASGSRVFGGDRPIWPLAAAATLFLIAGLLSSPRLSRPSERRG